MQPADHPICRIEFDGQSIDALAGQTLAAVLVGTGRWAVRENPVSGDLRGPYCGMGICFECEVQVAGLGRMRSCLVEVSEGIVIQTVPARNIKP